MKVEAVVRKIIKEVDDRKEVLRVDAAAGSDSGNIVMKSRRLAMEDSVFVRRIWYDTIYARRHK